MTSLLLSLLLATAPATAEERGLAVDTLIRRMDHYVFAEKKPAVVAALKANREKYLAAADDEAFRAAVSADLLAASGDKHLNVWIEAPRPPETAGGPPPRPADNYGIKSARKLPGGIGYLELTSFANEPESATAMDVAMAGLKGSRALIVDLRNNGGGGEVSFAQLFGHLFPERFELTGIEWRVCAPPPADRPDACAQITPRVERRFGAAPATPAFPTQPVYVLTSATSFSAAEAVAYELKRAGRATLVGEQTAGGGNPSVTMSLTERFSVIMPIGRMAPVAGADPWEGKGIAPHVPASKADALDTALAALTAG